ncbi:MAG: hypothetical protein QF922_02230 [SAR324 cluster bacterium]|nr:hypothetical protein [SAR324 cluster bacterium]
MAAAATTEICAVVSVIVDKAADLSERLRPAVCRELELEERLDSSSLTTLPESEELVPPLELLLEPLLEPLSEGLHPPTRASVSNTDVRR